MTRERQARWGLAALGVCGWALIWFATASAGERPHTHLAPKTFTAAGGGAVAMVAVLGLFALADWLYVRGRVADARLTVGIAISVAMVGLVTWLLDYLDQTQAGTFDVVGGNVHYTADSLDYAIRAAGIAALVAIAIGGIALAHIVSPPPTTDP